MSFRQVWRVLAVAMHTTFFFLLQLFVSYSDQSLIQPNFNDVSQPDVGLAKGTRRPTVNNLYDVFCCIADDEGKPLAVSYQSCATPI